MAKYVALHYEDPARLHPYYGTPYRWHNIVRSSDAERYTREDAKRWPGIIITVKSVRIETKPKKGAVSRSRKACRKR